MIRITTLLITLFFVVISFSQNRTCGHDVLMEKYLSNPDVQLKRSQIEEHTLEYSQQLHQSQSTERAVITIPVVVHVLYNTTAENISDAQIQSQMTVLNNDFRRLNSDANSNWSQAADVEIEFCLASVDPQGNSTTGITRTSTSNTTFSINTDNIKVSSQGGKDAWDASKYMNIWVGDIDGGLLGYATPPGTASPAYDGVVIDYTNFGTTGTVQSPYHLGRTATHEVGHYLNLYHIWGNNGGCSDDDGVSDTPISDQPYYGCPSNPFSCGSADMSENYMDYVNDGCMNLFTAGQKTRMRALFSTGGARVSLINSNTGCNSTSGGGSGGSGGVTGAGICNDPYIIKCGIAYNGSNTGSASNINSYSCANWDETGPEVVLAVSLGQQENLSVSLTNLTNDLDVAILSSCSSSSCLALGDNNASASNLSPGTYYIVIDGYAGATGDFTLQATCNSSYVANVNENELSGNNMITIYPNPTSSDFIYINSIKEKIVSKTIIDIQGKVINIVNNNELRIGVADLSTGTYFIQIQTESGNIVREKFIKL